MRSLVGSRGEDVGACNIKCSHCRKMRSTSKNNTKRNRKKRKRYLIGSGGDDVGAGEGGEEA